MSEKKQLPQDIAESQPKNTSPYNTMSFYFGRITENPTDANGKPLHVKPIISSNIIPLESNVLIDNAFVRSVERGENWALYCFTDAATNWIKAQFLVSYLSDNMNGNITHKWFDVQQEAVSFAESLSKT